MNPVVLPLQRAKLRISAHGFRQGRAERPKGRKPMPGFSGYSLKDAVLGVPIAGEDKRPTELEGQALALVGEAIRTLHPEVEGDDLIGAFNDAPGRTKDEVINVLQRAQNVAKATPARTRDEDETHQTAESSPSEPAPVQEMAETPARTDVDIKVNFHPLDHDKDGAKGGSFPADQRGLEALFAEAEALGITVDRRWTETRLREAIEAAKAEPPSIDATPEMDVREGLVTAKEMLPEINGPIPLPDIGPKVDLTASDGMEGIVTTEEPGKTPIPFANLNLGHHERQGTAYDSGAVGHELAGRAARPPLTLVSSSPRKDRDFFLGQNPKEPSA